MKERWLGLLLAATVVFLMSGCAALFPTERRTTESRWKTYAEVADAFDQIVPDQTTTKDLGTLGFDPTTSPNVKILTYVDIIQRFMPNPGITKADLHPSVRACIDAKEKSRAYEVELHDTKAKRHGNLLLDMAGFKRQTHESGWQFTGLILINGDLVVYKLSSGQPEVSREEKKVRPLGPLQELDNVLPAGISAVK
jgi:hypothetical protein